MANAAEDSDISIEEFIKDLENETNGSPVENENRTPDSLNDDASSNTSKDDDLSDVNKNNESNQSSSSSTASGLFKKLADENSELESKIRELKSKRDSLKIKAEKLELDVIAAETDVSLNEKQLEKDRESIKKDKEDMKNHLPLIDEYIDESMASAVESMRRADDVLLMLEELDGLQKKVTSFINPDTAFFASAAIQSDSATQDDLAKHQEKKLNEILQKIHDLQFKIRIREGRVSNLNDKLLTAYVEKCKIKPEPKDDDKHDVKMSIKKEIKPDPDEQLSDDDFDSDVKPKIKTEFKSEDEDYDEDNSDDYDEDGSGDDVSEDEEPKTKKIKVKDEPVSHDDSDYSD